MPLTTCFVDVFQSSTHNDTKTSSSSAGSVPTNEACHPQRMYSDMMTIENIAIHSKSFATSQQLHTFPVSNVSSSQMYESPNEMTCLTDSVRKVSPDSNGPYKSESPPRRNSSQTQIHPLVGMLSSGDSYKAPVHNANPVKDYCSPADKVQEGMSAGKKLSVHVAPFIPQLAKPYTEHREDALRITSTPLVVGTSDLHTNQCRQSTHTLPHRTTAPQVTRVCDHDSKDAQLDAVNIARGHVDLNRYQNGSDLDMKHVAETGLSRVSNIFGVYPTPLRSDLETSSMTTSVPSTQGIALTSQHELLNTYWSMVNVPANNHCLPSRASLGVAPISVIHPMYYPALDHTVFTPTAVTYNPFAAPHVGTMNHRDQTWSSPVYGVMNVSGLSQSGGMAHVEHRNTHNSNISETNLIRRNNMATHQIPGPYTTVSPSGEHKGLNASLTIDPIVRGLGPPMHSDRRLAIPNEDLRVPPSQNHDAQRSRNRNHNGRSSRTCMPSKTSVSEFPRKTYNTNIGPTGSHSFVSAPIEFSPREEEFVQYLRGRFFIEPRSIAVVVLKAIIESSDPTTVELYRDVMSPYRNSFHSFFDWHSDHFLLWNYKSDEIGALSLAPYFKQDETRVASRHFSYSSITEADRNYAQCLRKEENALVQHLVDRLKREGMSTMPRREVLEFLRADFPSSRIPGGLLCSANSFNRFVSRHNDVIACTATFITLRNNYNQIKERLARSTDQTKGELHTSADVLTEPIGMNIYPTHTAVNSGKEIFECANENVCVDLHQICADLLCVNKMCNLSQPISLQMDPACGLGNNSGVTNSSDSSDSEYNKIKVPASSGTSSDGRSVAGPVSCDPEDCDAVSF